MSNETTYIALLRGINVGGHHKVPMVELRKLLEEMEFSEVKTLLNSGNVVFKSLLSGPGKLEEQISTAIEKRFGFEVPVLIRDADAILDIIDSDPFSDITATEDTRFYVTFLAETDRGSLDLPWQSVDGSFRIISSTKTEVFGVLDLSRGKTTDAMAILGKTYGNNITTRNWNTVQKIGRLL